MNKKKKIANIIYENLWFAYCGNCRSYKEIEISDTEYGCDDCNRKKNGWGVSMEEAEAIADKIIHMDGGA